MNATFKFKKDGEHICHRCYSEDLMICAKVDMDPPNISIFDSINLCNNCGLLYGHPPDQLSNVLMGRKELEEWKEKHWGNPKK